MKYLKLFENQNIERICNEYDIENYHINSDGTVDVDGDVDLESYGLDKIPLNFGNVSGNFICGWNSLSNLIGCPKRVGGRFSCSKNNLTSLEGCPTYIGNNFYCIFNRNLWSFEGFPRHAKDISLSDDHFPRHAKGVSLDRTPIEPVFNLFRDIYLADGGEYFSTSGTMMDFFWDCDPVWPNKIIKKRRMNNFLASIDKELRTRDIKTLEKGGWKIED